MTCRLPPGRNDERILLFSVQRLRIAFRSFASQIVVFNGRHCTDTYLRYIDLIQQEIFVLCVNGYLLAIAATDLLCVAKINTRPQKSK